MKFPLLGIFAFVQYALLAAAMAVGVAASVLLGWCIGWVLFNYLVLPVLKFFWGNDAL